ALYPPTAFDATLYHLPFARAFVESGGVPYLLDRRVPVFPQVNEILFAAVMLFRPDVAAHGVPVLMTLVSAALGLEVGEAEVSGPPVGGMARRSPVPGQSDRDLSREHRLYRGGAHAVRHRRALLLGPLALRRRTGLADPGRCPRRHGVRREVPRALFP